MDDHTNRRTALPVGASRRGSCLLSVELNQETKGNHYPTRIGGSSRVTAIKSNRIEDKEQGQASRTGGRPSSSKSVAQKSALAAPKLASSSSSSLRKTRCMQQNSVTSGQWNTTRNVPARLDQVGKDGSAFPKELEPGPSSSSRLGLSEISNLTASEGSNSNFNLLQEAPASSPNRIFFHSNSSVERRESRMLSGTLLDRQGSWNDSDLLNVNGRLPDIAYDDEQQHDWGGIEGNGAVNLRVDPSIRSMAPTHMNDAESQSNIFGTGDHDTTSEDSFFTVASMTEDLYEMDVTTRNDSTLHASPLISQSAQEQGSLRRAMKGHADSPPVSLGEVVNISRPSPFKGKTSTTRTASQGTGKSSSQGILRAGSGSRERHGGRSSVGTSTSRRNIGNFGCTSASDALSSNYSSSNSQDFEKFGNRRPDLVRRVIDGHDSARGRRLAKVSAASSSGGAVVQRNIRSGVGIASHHPNSKANLPPPRASRTIHAMQPDTWCSQGLLAGDAVMESETSRESSSSSMRMADQTSLLGNRLGGSSPPSVRGRSAIGTLQRRNNISFGAACAFGEGMANRFVGSTSRSASSGHFGSAAGSVAPPRPPPGPSVAVSSRPHASAGAPVSLSFSGHVPPRAPPTALSSPISASFLSAVDTSSSNLFDGSVFGRSTSGNDGPPERSVPGHSEGVGRRAFRSFSIESETQSRYTMEGLAEVLLALEQIEQDEELTYEQVLMFEANLLFGGINIHDQHSDMRLDIDNMSYEELLALEERMGNVSTGLAEDVILKCLTRVRYSSVAAASSNSQESELKCSVCQEEYEERDELGRLRCDHSYHAVCIRQWLLQKNQCPICKAPASL